MRSTPLLLLLLGCSSTSSEDGGLLDATADTTMMMDVRAFEAATDASTETAPSGCSVTTCYGMVVIPPGGSVPYGDTCGSLCTCQCNGLCLGQCSFMPGCPCKDAGGQ